MLCVFGPSYLNFYDVYDKKNYEPVMIFSPSSRWELCDRNNIPEKLHQVLGKIFSNPTDEGLSINTFINGDYYRELDSKYGKDF